MTTGAPVPGATRPRRMQSRTLALIVGIGALVVVWVAALLIPVPYVIYRPGVTVNVLGTAEGGNSDEPIIEIDGHKFYEDDGQLRMTTVFVTQPEGRVNIFEAMWAWISDEQAVLPHDQVYPPGLTTDESRRESAIEMVSSQDAATAVALEQLGYDVKPVVQVLGVEAKAPADGKLKPRDVIVKVNGDEITSPGQVVKLVEGSAGAPVSFEIERDGKPRTVEVTPKKTKDGPRIGVQTGVGFDFPFDVRVNLDPSIGGPSAGLMFSLAIYDVLTPGSLTDGETIAGTGTIDEKGQVGRIGGIQQKIVAAREAGAELFLVPAGNCDDALGAPNEDMRLVKVETMPKALDAIETWTEDQDADLPTCERTG